MAKRHSTPSRLAPTTFGFEPLGRFVLGLFMMCVLMLATSCATTNLDDNSTPTEGTNQTEAEDLPPNPNSDESRSRDSTIDASGDEPGGERSEDASTSDDEMSDELSDSEMSDDPTDQPSDNQLSDSPEEPDIVQRSSDEPGIDVAIEKAKLQPNE